MKRLFTSSIFLIIVVMIMCSCASPSAPTDEETTPSLTVSPEDQETKPVYGGTLKIVSGFEPVMLGYPPFMGPEDSMRIVPGVEKLMDLAANRNEGNGLEPVLAERVVEDFENNRIIFHLRPGVTFHDGSVLNADVVIWNYEQLVSSGCLQFIDYWKGIKKNDDMTVQIDYTGYSNQLIQSWGTIFIYSKEAWEKASGGDTEAGINWARTHCVGTGPFILEEFKRNIHMNWIRNPDYWQQGKPYLDGIEIRFIPENTTARALMLAGEADYWEFYYSLELEEHGFNVWSSWAGLILSIWPNTADPDSKWNDIRLRQAIEYAIDKKAITDAFGPDTFKPVKMIAPPGEWGYDPAYPAREFDPEKARQLVIDAGYPDGLDAELLLGTAYGGEDLADFIQQYLDDVGIRIEVDLADPGRFFGTIYGQNPGPDLVITFSGIDINYLVTYMRWFSTTPLINVSYLGHTEEQRTLDEEAACIQDLAAQKAMTEKIIKYLTDNVMVIPLMWFGMRQIVAPYVHGPTPVNVSWHTEEVWMEEHIEH
jgi:peptide/nickel transport system substrate-binding protein